MGKWLDELGFYVWVFRFKVLGLIGVMGRKGVGLRVLVLSFGFCYLGLYLGVK